MADYSERAAELSRSTGETSVRLELLLEGAGFASTGAGFGVTMRAAGTSTLRARGALS